MLQRIGACVYAWLQVLVVKKTKEYVKTYRKFSVSVLVCRLCRRNAKRTVCLKRKMRCNFNEGVTLYKWFSLFHFFLLSTHIDIA